MTWGAVLTINDGGAVANLGYTQQLTFSGPSGAGYIGIYAYDFFSWFFASGGSFYNAVESNLPMLKTFDPSSCMECQGIPLPMIPITFGTPITLEVSHQGSGTGGYFENQYVSESFQVLQIYVFDKNQKLITQIESPTTEFADVQVPVSTPEPATMGLTAAAILASVLGYWSRRKTKRG